MILSILSHHIIACYYVEYENDHIVATKYGTDFVQCSIEFQSVRLVSSKDNSSTMELIVFLLNNRHEADEFCSSMDFCFRAVYIANEQNSDISKKLSLLTVSLSSTQQLRSSFDSTASSSTPSTVRSLSLASASSSHTMPSSTSLTIDDTLSVSTRSRHR
jgi:hypothetical protein